MRVYFEIQPNEIEIKIDEVSKKEEFLFNGINLQMSEHGYYYIYYLWAIPPGIIVSNVLMERVKKVEYSTIDMPMPTMRRYGFYELGKATLDVSTGVQRKGKRLYNLALISDNLADAVALYKNFMAGTIWPTMDYEAVQEDSQKALLEKIKSDGAEKQITKNPDNLGLDKESLSARLLKAEQRFHLINTPDSPDVATCLDKAERHFELNQFEECHKYLLALGF